MQLFERDHDVEVPDRQGLAGEDRVSPCAEVSRANGLPAKPSGRSLEIEALLWRWRAAAAAATNELPPFEELALGNLGRMSDRAALVRLDPGHSVQLLRAGDAFAGWIGHRISTFSLTRPSTGKQGALFEVVTEALDARRPACKTVHSLANYIVCIDDVLALPLANRWGPPLCLVYVHERDRDCSLLEFLFQAVADGVVALAVIHDRAGHYSIAAGDMALLGVKRG